MTPSEKPERSGSQSEEDANPTSVITHTSDETENSTSSDDGTNSTGEGDALEGTDAPPPWQRASSAPSTSPNGSGADDGDQDGDERGSAEAEAPKSVHEQDTVRTEVPKQPLHGDASRSEQPPSERASAPFGAGSTRTGSTTGAGSSSRRPSRGPRRASLQVKRVDPWSVLKLALVLSVALFFVWMIAVAVLYGVLDGMGVWDQLNGTFTELTQADNTASESLISAGRVFSVASIIGGINIVLVTALATVAAFIYNVAADFAGGIELTLSERE